MNDKNSIHTQEKLSSSTKKSFWTRDFILIALINLTTFVGFNMTTIGMPIYVAKLGAPDLIVGLVTTVATGAALFIRPFSGIMLDRFGRKGILISSIGAMAVIIAAYAVFPVLGIIVTLRFFHGIGWGLGSTAISTIAADIIPKKRFAEGMGYFALSASLATAVAPALSMALIQNVGINPMIIVASSCTIISLIFAIFQHASKIEKVERKRKIQMSDFFDKRALLPASMMFLLNCAFASVITFIALHGQAKGIDNLYLYFIVYAIVTIISRPITGKIIDKTGFFMPGILSALGVAITLVLISISTNITMFCIAGIFAGLGIGTGMGTLQTMAVASVPSERRGVATSTYLFGLDAGIAVGAAIAGAIAGAVGYSNMYLIIAVFPIIACLIFIILGKKRISQYSKTN